MPSDWSGAECPTWCPAGPRTFDDAVLVVGQVATDSIRQHRPPQPWRSRTPEPDAILPAGFETRLPEFRNIVLKHVSNVLIRDLDAKAEMDAAQAELEEKLVKKP